MAKLEEKLEERLADFEKRVTQAGNQSEKINKKVSEVENKLASANSSVDNNVSNASVSNLTRIEELSTQLEEVKLELAQLKLNQTSPKLDLKGKEINDWFNAKFHAYLEAPRARKNINDCVDTKVHTHQVHVVMLILFR